MKLLNVKGCSDYLPKEQVIRNYINDKLKETFIEFGYQSIETPILCYYDILSGKYDEDNDILKEIYKLSDQGGRELGLRYDLTVPFAKFIALNKNNIVLPFKRYEISKVFRDGPIKLGRDREFTQCDVDVVGLSGQMIEAECLSLYVSAFNKLGIGINIKYNSRNLIRGLILSCGVNEDKISAVITIIDKMNKITRDEFVNSLLKLGLDESQIDRLLDLFKLSLSDLNNEFSNSDILEINTGLMEINSLDKYIDGLGIREYCSFDPTLARGQDYYTGNVFEVFDKSGYVTSSIGAGGRYDNMITEYIDDGNIYPAIGISFGLSSIYEILKNRSDIIDDSLIDLYIIPMDTDLVSLSLANKLRNRGVRVVVEMNKRKIKKCFEWANKNKVPYVMVIGDNEVDSGSINIKNMKTGEVLEYKIDDIDKIKDDIL